MEDHPFRVDLIATLAALLFVVPCSLVGSSVVASPAAWVALALFPPLPWRRTRPTTSAILVHSFALLHWIAGMPLILPADFAVLIAIYSVAGHGPRWASRAGLLSGVLGALLLGGSAMKLSNSYSAGAGFASTAAALEIGSAHV